MILTTTADEVRLLWIYSTALAALGMPPRDPDDIDDEADEDEDDDDDDDEEDEEPPVIREPDDED
jgi:hypothetical protein